MSWRSGALCDPGYYTDVYENEWTTVTSDDAHAWVEIYLNGIGWLRDDPTPAADTPAQTAPEEPIGRSY